jgi:ech hydrogenase subunit E
MRAKGKKQEILMNTTTDTLHKAQTLLASWTENFNTPEPNRLDVAVSPQELLSAAGTLQTERWGYLAAITGLDHGAEQGELEALYHFCSGPTIVTLRVLLPRENPVLPSLYKIAPAACVHERELQEMFGIIVQNSPDPSHLLLPDDWPEGVYPLREEFDAAKLAHDYQPKPLEKTGKQDGRFVIPIGPQHPALKEPEHFEFAVDGEIVTGASVRLGYVHRGVEKATEQRTWVQNLYLLERICGICSHIHATAYCLGVEQLAGVTAPPRAQAIRELVAGLERIHSHLLWFGVSAHEAGFDTLFMYIWRDRETVMDLLEEISGNRVNYSANVLGGVKFDITNKQKEMTRHGLNFLDERLRHYLDVVTKDAAFVQRTRGIGVMTRDQANQLGTLGPTARASGVERDIRVEAPYSAYTEFPIPMVVEKTGDLEARFVVRLKELLESNNTICDILDRMPTGDLKTRMPRRIKPGETISRVEAPRGELFYFIKSNGSDMPARIKVRTPTLCNMASVVTLAVGHQLADMPMILAGVDPCFSCNDRAVVIKPQSSSGHIWTWEQLRQHGIDYYQNRDFGKLK